MRAKRGSCFVFYLYGFVAYSFFGEDNAGESSGYENNINDNNSRSSSDNMNNNNNANNKKTTTPPTTKLERETGHNSHRNNDL